MIDLPKKKNKTRNGSDPLISYKLCLAPVYPQYQRGTDGTRMSSLKHVRFFPRRLIGMCQLCRWQSLLVEGLREVIHKAELQLLHLQCGVQKNQYFQLLWELQSSMLLTKRHNDLSQPLPSSGENGISQPLKRDSKSGQSSGPADRLMVF